MPFTFTIVNLLCVFIYYKCIQGKVNSTNINTTNSNVWSASYMHIMNQRGFIVYFSSILKDVVGG